MTDLAVVNLDTGEIVDRDTGEVIDRSQIRFATVAVRDLTPQKHNTRTASESLIETIRQDGLHEPLTVSPSLTITGGHRRYRAVQILGWETVPVIIDERLGSDEEYAVRTELTLNEEREPFTALERAELARRLEVLVHGPAAKARQEASQAQPGNDLASKSRTENGGGPQEPPPFGNGKARDAAAREAGMSPTTYRRITTVRNATKDDTLPDDVRAVAAQALQDIEAGGAIVHARCGPTGLGRTLRIIRDAYGDYGFIAQVLDGLGHLTHRYNGDLDDTYAIGKLSKAHGGVAGLLNRAENIHRSTGNPKAQCVAAAAVDIINANTRGNKRLSNWWRDAS